MTVTQLHQINKGCFTNLLCLLWVTELLSCKRKKEKNIYYRPDFAALPSCITYGGHADDSHCVGSILDISFYPGEKITFLNFNNVYPTKLFLLHILDKKKKALNSMQTVVLIQRFALQIISILKFEIVFLISQK